MRVIVSYVPVIPSEVFYILSEIPDSPNVRVLQKGMKPGTSGVVIFIGASLQVCAHVTVGGEYLRKHEQNIYMRTDHRQRESIHCIFR